MAKTPAPDTERSLGKLEGQVTILLTLAASMIAAMLLLLGGGFVMYRDVGEVKVTIAELKGSVGALSGTIDAVDRKVAEGANDQGRILTAVAGIQDQLKAAGPDDIAGLVLPLTAEDEAVIRKFFGIPPRPDGKPNYKLGDAVPKTAVKPVPGKLIDALPKLAGLRLTVDADGSIVFTAGPNNRAVAIVSPA